MEKTTRTISLSIAFALSLFAPVSALAYLSPDQVFGGSSITLQAPPPPTAREGEQVNQTQQQRAAERRTEAQSSLQSVTAEQPDTYQAPTTPQPLGLFNNDAQYEQRMQRIQAEKSSGPTIIIGGNGDVIDANGNVLHSGAPRVSATGPETVLTGLAIILAAVCTFGFAMFQSRRVANKAVNA